MVLVLLYLAVCWVGCSDTRLHYSGSQCSSSISDLSHHSYCFAVYDYVCVQKKGRAHDLKGAHLFAPVNLKVKLDVNVSVMWISGPQTAGPTLKSGPIPSGVHTHWLYVVQVANNGKRQVSYLTISWALKCSTRIYHQKLHTHTHTQSYLARHMVSCGGVSISSVQRLFTSPQVAGLQPKAKPGKTAPFEPCPPLMYVCMTPSQTHYSICFPGDSCRFMSAVSQGFK